jgi:hypothetical protein
MPLIELLIRWLVRLWKRQRREWLETDALDWPRTLGTVVVAQPKVTDDQNPWKQWSVELRYAYTVKGEYYSGSHDLPPESEDDAAEDAGRWKERNLVVRYSPQDIEKSVILMRDQTTAAVTELEQP